MSITSVDLFECDRCGDVSKKDRGVQPSDWATVYVASPPRRSANEANDAGTVLCWQCRNKLRRWLKEPDPEAMTTEDESS